MGAGLFPLDPGPAGTGLPCRDPWPSPCRIAICFFRASSRILLYVASLPGTASNHARRCSAVMLNTSVHDVTEGVPAREVLVGPSAAAEPGLGVLVAGGRAPGTAGRTEGFTATGGRAAAAAAAVAGGLASGGAVGCKPGLGGGCVCPGGGGRCGTAPGRGAGLVASAGVLVVVVVAGDATFGAGLARGDSVALVAARGMAGLMDGGRDANGLGMLLFCNASGLSLCALRGRHAPCTTPRSPVFGP